MNLPESKEINLDVVKMKKTVMNFIVPLLSFAAIVVLAVVFVFPIYKELPTLNEELESEKSLKASLTQKKGVLNKLVNYEDVLNEDKELIDRVLVSEPEQPELLAQVNKISEEVGFEEVTKLSYTTTGAKNSETTDYDTVTVSFGATGSYEQLTAFLNSIEDSARLVTVTSYRFTEDEEEDVLDQSFVLSSPYLFVQSTAVVDVPVTLDLQDKGFQDVLNALKDLKYYKITEEDYIDVIEVDEEVVEGEESLPAETEAAEIVDTGPTEEEIVDMICSDPSNCVPE